MLSAMDKSDRAQKFAAWLLGVVGATLVFLATVPPDIALSNLRLWADTVGLPWSNVLFGFIIPRIDSPFGLRELMVAFGSTMLMLAVFFFFEPDFERDRSDDWRVRGRSRHEDR